MTRPHTSYLICSTARSGSTLLCEALSSTGLAGWPDEYFLRGRSTLREPVWFRDLDTMPYPDYVRSIVEHNTGANGVFGAKLSWPNIEQFDRELRKYPEFRNLPMAQILDSFFPNLHYVWVTRRDKVRQAASVWKAMQTNAWNSATAWVPVGDRLPRFSFPLLNEKVQTIMIAEAQFGEFFQENRIRPLTVVYEDFTLDYDNITAEVLRFLDIPVPDPFELPPPRVKKQADTLNEEWVRRYHRVKQYEYRVGRVLSLPLILSDRNLFDRYIRPAVVRRLGRDPGRPIHPAERDHSRTS